MEAAMDEIEYAGFWKRFGAYLLDVLFMLPLTGIAFWLSSVSKSYYLYYLIPGTLFGLWFHVYLVKRYAGTPGKLVMKIQIRKVDGSRVGYREAFLRYSVLFILTILISVAFIIASYRISDAEYHSLTYTERSLRLMSFTPGWYKIVNILMNVWIWSEFIVILTNKKRRAIHDFIAGTVVAHKPSRISESNLS